MSPWHGWMYMVDANGILHEVVNQARTADYLRNVGLGDAAGSFCDIREDGGCAAYRWRPPCGPEEESNPSYVSWPSGASTELNVLHIPDNANFSAPTQLDLRFAVAGIASGSGARYLSAHQNNAGAQAAFRCFIDSSDRLSLSTSTDGTNFTAVASNSALTTTDDLVLARITWRSSDGRVQYFRKLGIDLDEIAANLDSDFGWESNGTNDTASTAALFNATSPLSIGNFSSTAGANAFIGQYYAMSLATTIDGVPVFRWVPGDINGALTNSFFASTGQTVTVTRDLTPGPGLTIYYDAFEGWDIEFYSAPDTDPAPWYSASRPESADALGFWITEWTGLDNGHVTRPSQPHGGAGGGTFHGALTAAGRTMAVKLILFARSERAMQYLFDWLSTTLYSACNPCAGDSMLIRRFCLDPETEGSPWQGVAKLNNVDVMSGPLWEVEPQLRNQCLIRGASVVFEAGDPCMYLTGESIDWDGAEPTLTTCFGDTDAADGRIPCRPTCVDLDASAECRWTTSFEVEPAETSLVPVVTLNNATTEYSVPCRIQFFIDPLDLGLDNICALQRIGQLYVRALRPGAQLVWDVSTREVYYRDHTTAGLVDGSAFIDANDPPLRRSFVLPCGTVHVVVEPATLCLTDLGAGSWSDGTHTFEDPRLPTPSLKIMQRVGCP